MENKTNISYWKEPAHPSIVKLHDDLVSIYSRIREKYQKEIDNAFDRISRQIGFVVTTTVPVVLEVGNRGDVKGIRMGAEHLNGTLFEKELSAALESLTGGDPIPGLTEGTYRLSLIWFDALKLKFRTEWMEPAHFRTARTEIAAKFGGRIPIPWVEPAHWFDPGYVIGAEDAVMIEAIDEVYPELRLSDRVALSRETFRKVNPEVMEPAHFRQFDKGLASELTSVIRRYSGVNPEVMEPAHFRQFEKGLASELTSVIRRYSGVNPEVMEPAHFRQFEKDLASELTSVLRRYSGVNPEVMEPAHFRQFEKGLASELTSVLRRYGY
jgi:hypothetical protein